MTLGEFFQHCSENPTNLKLFFAALPLTAGLALLFGKNEGHLFPWKYLYSILVYACCIPGVFSITLSVYKFLFERGSIMDANIWTQILPILVMIITLWLIKKNVPLDNVPGFDKIGSLIFFLTILIIFLWILEKTNIYVISFLPFWQFVAMFLLFIVLLRFGIKRLFSN
jgi:hypothetical protein